MNQRTAYLQMQQMRQAVLLCYLQILRQFLISKKTQLAYVASGTDIYVIDIKK